MSSQDKFQKMKQLMNINTCTQTSNKTLAHKHQTKQLYTNMKQNNSHTYFKKVFNFVFTRQISKDETTVVHKHSYTNIRTQTFVHKHETKQFAHLFQKGFTFCENKDKFQKMKQNIQTQIVHQDKIE